jgi:hypothetical protein
MDEYGTIELLQGGSIGFRSLSPDYVRRDSSRAFLHPADAPHEPTTIVFDDLTLDGTYLFTCDVYVAHQLSAPVLYELELFAGDATVFKASTVGVSGSRRSWELALPPLAGKMSARISTRMVDDVSAAHAWAWIASPKLVRRGEGSGAAAQADRPARPLDYSAEGRYAAKVKDTVCLCVVMNHPHPENIERIDRMYGDRFERIRYLIPFHQSDDPRIITVYRGSYTHHAYLADAYERLKDEDVTHYVVCQDDVLLNPRINGRNLTEVFDLGPDDGFIDQFKPFPDLDDLTSWHWGHSVLLKMLFPRSAIWGSGVDFENLLRFLPPAQVMTDILARHGFTPERVLSLKTKTVEEFIDAVSPNALFNALTDLDPARLARNASALRDIFTSAFEYAGGDGSLDLRYPFAMCGAQADFYIIPKTGLKRFAHVAGVLGADQVFAEVATPTTLLLSAGRVRTSADVGVQMAFFLHGSGYDRPEDLTELFKNPAFLGAHPVKLSKFRDNYMQLVAIPAE